MDLVVWKWVCSDVTSSPLQVTGLPASRDAQRRISTGLNSAQSVRTYGFANISPALSALRDRLCSTRGYLKALVRHSSPLQVAGSSARVSINIAVGGVVSSYPGVLVLTSVFSSSAVPLPNGFGHPRAGGRAAGWMGTELQSGRMRVYRGWRRVWSSFLTLTKLLSKAMPLMVEDMKPNTPYYTCS